MVLTSGKSNFPFFGKPLSIITGLDPLGLQSGSEKAYQHLLPGMTNVTGQIRAYGFYCWLLLEYQSKFPTGTSSHQRQFIRSAEVLLAYIGVLNNRQGIGGRNYATKEIEKGSPFPIPKSGGYWKYTDGVLGQYYRNTLMTLGLMGEEVRGGDSLFTCTQEKQEGLIDGHRLAKAFHQSLTPGAATKFLDTLTLSQIGIDELMELSEYFDLLEIPRESHEQDVLLQLLFGPDLPVNINESPAYHRRSTLVWLLKYFHNHPNESSGLGYKSFLDFAFANGINEDECLLGWYYYELNEQYHFAVTSVFSSLLVYLDKNHGGQWINVDDLLSAFQNDLLSKLSDYLPITGLKNLSITQVADNFDKLKFTLDMEQDAALYLIHLLHLWNIHRENTDVILEFRSQLPGAGRDIFFWIQLLDKWANSSLDVFVNYLLRQIILQRHRFVALAKRRSAEQSTEKVIIEGHLIRFVSHYSPTHTMPRLDVAIRFLQHLHLLDENKNVTSKGVEYL